MNTGNVPIKKTDLVGSSQHLKGEGKDSGSHLANPLTKSGLTNLFTLDFSLGIFFEKRTHREKRDKARKLRYKKLS